MIPFCFMCVKILLDDFMFSLFFDKTCQYKFYVCPIKFLICMRGQRIREHAQHGKCLILSLEYALICWAMLCTVPWRSVIHCRQSWNVNKNWWDDLRRWHYNNVPSAALKSHLIFSYKHFINIAVKYISCFSNLTSYIVNWGGIPYPVKSVRKNDFNASTIIFANFSVKKCCNFQSNDTDFAFALSLNRR